MSHRLIDWTSDFMLVAKGKAEWEMREQDIWALPLSGSRSPFLYLSRTPGGTAGRLSPNGRWFAYRANEKAARPVYVQSFPDPLQRRQQITSYGSQPRWRRDGRELFYLDRDRRMMAVSLVAEETLTIQKTTHLFTAPASAGSFDVTPDGQRFLFNVSSPVAPITVVLNWTAGLKSAVTSDK